MESRKIISANRSTLIHLVRHGEVNNPQHLLYGRLSGFRLTQRGHRQALATGELLKARPIGRIYTSPLLRARQTAAQIAGFHGAIKIHVSVLLNEISTPFEGLPSREVESRMGGDIYAHGQKGNFEQPGDILKRVQRFLQRILHSAPDGEVVAVTHGDVIVFAALWALAAEVIPQNKSRLRHLGFPAGYPAHASITSLSFTDGTIAERPGLEYFAVNV
jgi:broad specificity phosphatase PhoE